METVFEPLVAHFEKSLLPLLRAEEPRLRSSGRFTSVEVVSVRHAEAIHAMGIACRPTWASIDLERLVFSVTLIGMTGLSGRIDVQWSQSFNTRIGTGYLKRETGGFQSKLETEAQIARFEKKWHRLFGLFLRVASRGKPSIRLLRHLRGAPKDQYGWKVARNQPPISTPATIPSSTGTTVTPPTGL
jgi:hypothetical protein